MHCFTWWRTQVLMVISDNIILSLCTSSAMLQQPDIGRVASVEPFMVQCDTVAYWHRAPFHCRLVVSTSSAVQ